MYIVPKLKYLAISGKKSCDLARPCSRIHAAFGTLILRDLT